MSVVAGFFFGLYVGIILTVLNATLSATITYLVGKKYIYTYLKRKYTKKVESVEREVENNGPYYVLAVRFSSILPFFWVNILFGASGIGYKSYIIPTFIGVIPGTFVYSNMGTSLSTLESLKGFFSLEIALSFLLLGVLAILPVVYRRVKTRLTKENYVA
ncbi:MAG: TVP38/TMEM64 family protein [Campylobacterales bacterium]